MKILYSFIFLLLIVFRVYSEENMSAERVIETLNQANLLYQVGEIEKAANEYKKIVNFSKDLKKDEKLRMAKVFSWTGNFKEALILLNSLYEENPEDIEIALVYARTLSWNREFEKSLKILDKILEKEPQNIDALLIKANIYRWQGDISKSIYFYEKIFSLDPNNFDAKVSYGYALLSLEKRKELSNLINSVEPKYSYQEKDYKDLKNSYLNKFNPALSFGYSYYHDSDHNNIERLLSQFSFWLDNYKFTFDYKEHFARGSIVSLNGTEYSVSISNRVDPKVDWSAYLGSIRVSNSKSKDFIIGGLSTNIKIDKDLIGLTFNSRLLTDTSFLLDRNIRLSSLSLFLNHYVSDKINIYFSFSPRFYSDGNSALFLQFAPIYKITSTNPSLSVGYRIIYLTFKDHKMNGYFDPKDYISNQIFFPVYFEGDKLTFYFEPYVGQQSFKRYGNDFNDTIIGFFSTIEYKIGERLYLGGSIEGGNYSLGTASGWKYYLIGINLKYIF